MDDAHTEIVRRLTLIQATLQVAFAEQLGAARDRVRDEPVGAAILDATDAWTASTELQKQVSSSTKKSARTVQRALADLVAQGALESRGSERRLEFRRTGLM
jgi:hypothetical protein